MSLTGFQRRRRMLAEKKLQEETVKVQESEQTPVDPEDKPTQTETDKQEEQSAGIPNDVANALTGDDNDEQTDAQNDQTIEEKDENELTDEQIDSMDREALRATLDAMGVQYAHNTGEDKLREKLRNEFSGSKN